MGLYGSSIFGPNMDLSGFSIFEDPCKWHNFMANEKKPTLREWLGEEEGFGLAVSPGLCCELASFGCVLGLVEAFEDERAFRSRVLCCSGASSGAKVAATVALHDVSLHHVAELVSNLDFSLFLRPGSYVVRLLEDAWGGSRDFEADCSVPFATTAFDLRRWNSVVLDRGDLAWACHASGSFPLLFRPVVFENRLLTDFAAALDPGGLRAMPPSCKRILHIVYDSWAIRPADKTLSIHLRRQVALIPIPGLFSRERAARALRYAKECTVAALDRPLKPGSMPGHWICVVEPPSTRLGNLSRLLYLLAGSLLVLLAPRLSGFRNR